MLEFYFKDGRRALLDSEQIAAFASAISESTIAMHSQLSKLSSDINEVHEFIKHLGGIPGVSDLISMAAKINSDADHQFDRIQEVILLKALLADAVKIISSAVGSSVGVESAAFLGSSSLLLNQSYSLLPKYHILPHDASVAMCKAGGEYMANGPSGEYECMGRFLVAYQSAVKAFNEENKGRHLFTSEKDVKIL